MAKEDWKPSIIKPEAYKVDEVVLSPEALAGYDQLMYAFGTSEPKAAILALGLSQTPRSIPDFT